MRSRCLHAIRGAEAEMLWRLLGCEPGDRIRLNRNPLPTSYGWVLGKEWHPETEQLIADVARDTGAGEDTLPALVALCLLEPVPNTSVRGYALVRFPVKGYPVSE